MNEIIQREDSKDICKYISKNKVAECRSKNFFFLCTFLLIKTQNQMEEEHPDIHLPGNGLSTLHPHGEAL